jgi:hypothetical protein
MISSPRAAYFVVAHRFRCPETRMLDREFRLQLELIGAHDRQSHAPDANARRFRVCQLVHRNPTADISAMGY